jgi:hypothetical protein
MESECTLSAIRLRDVSDMYLMAPSPPLCPQHVPLTPHPSPPLDIQSVPPLVGVGTTNTHLKWMAPRADSIEPRCMQGVAREERSRDGFILLHWC